MVYLFKENFIEYCDNYAKFSTKSYFHLITDDPIIKQFNFLKSDDDAYQFHLLTIDRIKEISLFEEDKIIMFID